MKYQRSVFENHLVAAMTSGLGKKSPTYQMPESVAMEYARLCYNQGISDAVCFLQDYAAPRKDQAVYDLAEALSSLNILQRELHERASP